MIQTPNFSRAENLMHELVQHTLQAVKLTVLGMAVEWLIRLMSELTGVLLLIWVGSNSNYM